MYLCSLVSELQDISYSIIFGCLLNFHSEGTIHCSRAIKESKERKLDQYSLEQCFSNFFTSGRTYEITKALGRITDFYIEKLVIKFENRKMIKKYTEITICLLDITFYI